MKYAVSSILGEESGDRHEHSPSGCNVCGKAPFEIIESGTLHDVMWRHFVFLRISLLDI